MAKDFSICVGTIGSGAWLSPDGGETWRIHRNPRLGLGAYMLRDPGVLRGLAIPVE